MAVNVSTSIFSSVVLVSFLLLKLALCYGPVLPEGRCDAVFAAAARPDAARSEYQ